MSAHSICSHMRSTTCRVLSTYSPVPRSGRSCSLFRFWNSSKKVEPSTTVTMVCNRAPTRASGCEMSALRKLSRTCTRRRGGSERPSPYLTHTLPQSRAHTSRGSATPDDSIRMWSHGTLRSRESFISCPMPCRNSSAAVQQAQPFCSSTVSSGDDVPPVFLDTSAASMFISATSFTMRPTLIPALFSSRCFSSVVLPAPRKPESSVIGVGVPRSMIIAAFGRTAEVCWFSPGAYPACCACCLAINAHALPATPLRGHRYF